MATHQSEAKDPEMPSPETPPLIAKTAIGQSNGLLEKLLDSLSPEITAKLMELAALRDVGAGEVVVDRGVRCEEIGYVLDGTLAMVQVMEDGKKHIVGLLVPTDIYGRIFDGPSNYRIEALTPTRTLSFPRGLFEQVLRENPNIERLFLVHLLDEMDAAREWLLLINGRKAVNRLASFLMILLRRSQFKKVGNPSVVHVPLTRKDLAHYLGARPETLSRAFKALERNGILRIVDPNHFEILDSRKLLVAAGDDLLLQHEQDDFTSSTDS
ncbi:MAG: Crp/Fnr family transcriptional regulator [Pseudotabrizicola sp.]|uniref:Crp/Fnr family transcriptional regulator n=1 Tax=Pseudotabrizicola sp. TaxID=2939647 RepID=UPI00273007A9|nr:Crp/Fnr family transcriptional regulator [Pseudotabrizicola sp.]MDZ7576351.1 Crp/Fnr family transcriptional regulator [Pseudotabrizicola sp.]